MAQLRSPNIQNYTLVQQDRRQGPLGGLLLFHSQLKSTSLANHCQHRQRMTLSRRVDHQHRYG